MGGEEEEDREVLQNSDRPERHTLSRRWWGWPIKCMTCVNITRRNRWQ